MNSAQLTRRFEDSFGSKPRIFCAPGRVNLLGEHTDYNEGFVIALCHRVFHPGGYFSPPDRGLVIQSEEFSEKYEFDLDNLPSRGQRCMERLRGWCRGHAAADGTYGPGGQLAGARRVPIGAGLSSSAAIEVAVRSR